MWDPEKHFFQMGVCGLMYVSLGVHKTHDDY